MQICVCICAFCIITSCCDLNLLPEWSQLEELQKMLQNDPSFAADIQGGFGNFFTGGVPFGSCSFIARELAYETVLGRISLDFVRFTFFFSADVLHKINSK